MKHIIKIIPKKEILENISNAYEFINFNNMIPTAKEFFTNENVLKLAKEKNIDIREAVQEMRIEFAKLHVQEALKQASEKVELDGDEGSNFDYISVNENSILNAYPLDNIK